MSGVAQDADGHAVGFARRALEVADQEGHQIGGHFGRGGEFERVLASAGAGGVGNDGAVGDGRVACIHHQRNVISGLESWLVEAGEGAARVGGLELRDGVVAVVAFGEIEAAQLVVQNAGVTDGERGLARGQVSRGR